ncbi:MAG: 2,3-diketo-5-methylthio-phosphopentane phosphatase [Candidatus Eremiobacteraeota bacterium]|nr:2,3-diketo-5-methylthio-phosphopentane phosphatase [Candidatus Eremiobacteraeota bacterium]
MSATARIAARAVLVDIEGTTSTIAFVHEVLSPYADAHLDAYVAAHREEPEVVQVLLDAARLAGLEPDVDDATVLAHLHAWIAEDRKATPLKTLQGLIWAEGYAQTGLRGHVYPDAVAGLRRWYDAGVRLYVYSSGSVEAQRVLFANSDQGDLSPLFDGYFDTTTGPKREPPSYAAIANAIDLAPADVLFLSDVDPELDAARTAGMRTVRLLRPADTPAGATTTHASAISFDEIDVAPPLIAPH